MLDFGYFPTFQSFLMISPFLSWKYSTKPNPNRLRDPIICLEIPIPSRFSLDFPAEKLCKYCSVSTLPNPKLLNDSKLSTRAPTHYTLVRENNYSKMLMISFNTVDYRSSMIKFAAYNTKYFFEKETSQKRSAKGRKRILCQLLKENRKQSSEMWELGKAKTKRRIIYFVYLFLET